MSKTTNKLSQQVDNMEESLTIMVTDLKNASFIANVESDAMKHRQHHDIASLAIQLNNGVFVKAVDDDMLFRFNSAQDAISAAVEIQKEIDRVNMTNKFKNPVLMRISLHSGKCVTKDREFPDEMINAARHMKSLTLPGETFASQDTCNAIGNMPGINFRSINQSIPSKKEPVSIYKLLWNPQEVELDNLQGANATPTEQPVATSKFKLILIVVIPLLLVLLLTLHEKIISQLSAEYEPRAIHQSIER